MAPDPTDPYAGDDFLRWFHGAPLALALGEPAPGEVERQRNLIDAQAALMEPGVQPVPPSGPAPLSVSPLAAGLPMPLPMAAPAAPAPPPAKAGATAPTAKAPPAPEPPADAGPSPLGAGLHPLTGAPQPTPDSGAPPSGDLENPYSQALGGSVGGIPASALDQGIAGVNADPFNYTDEEAAARDLARMRETDPERAAMFEARRNSKRDAERQAREHELAFQQKDAAERNWSNYVAANENAARKVAEIEADSKALAAKKLDPGHYAKNRGALGTIADIAMGIVGGLIQGRTGAATNQGLQMIQQAVDRDIEAQKADIENGRADIATRRGLVAEEYARHGDLFRASEAVRAATYERAARMIETDMQAYDPKGTTIVKYADMLNGIRGLQQQSAAQRHQAALNEAKLQLELEGKDLDNRAKAAKLAGGGGVASGVSDKAVLPAEEWARRYGIAAPPQLQGMQLSGKEFADIVGKGLDLQKKGAEIEGAAQEQTVYGITGEPLFKTAKEDAAKLRAAQPGTIALIGGLDQLRKLRGREGGASKHLDPGTFADYNQVANQVVNNFAAANGLSLSDKQSQDFARDIVLGGDPTDYRVGDLEKRISKAQKAAEDAYNNKLKAAGYKGPRIELVAAETARTGLTPDIDTLQQRTGNTNLGDASKDYSAPATPSAEFK